jgi:DNA-binding transcriptional MocR family regulator
MTFYEVLQAIAAYDGPRLCDLSTGSPVVLDVVQAELAEALRRLAARPDVLADLGSYRHLDGVPELAEAFAAHGRDALGIPASPARVVVTPGSQAALRYLHEWLRTQGKRLLFPLGLEFAGAVDPLAPEPPSVGPYRSHATGAEEAGVAIDLDALDWRNVGAVLLSQPHTPTGRLWTANEIVALAEAAARHRAWLILDQCYSLPWARLTAAPVPAVSAANVIHLYSFSKVGLAAARVGAVLAPPEVAGSLRGLLRRHMIQPPLLGQHLALALLNFFRRRPDVARLIGVQYQVRWLRCRELLRQAGLLGSLVRVGPWEGGPFLWCEWRGAPSSADLFEALLRQGVAVAPSCALQVSPGSAAGCHAVQGLRIGLGAPEGDLYEGVATLGRVGAAARLARVA